MLNQELKSGELIQSCSLGRRNRSWKERCFIERDTGCGFDREFCEEGGFRVTSATGKRCKELPLSEKRVTCDGPLVPPPRLQPPHPFITCTVLISTSPLLLQHLAIPLTSV